MKVSVIMLTYNREQYVSRMIECILGQTLTDFEYIIVDNGSSDRSGDIADEYAMKDKRIKVIHKEKGNIGSGRNVGLDIAMGDYIAFIDDDDYVEKEYLEYLYTLAVEYDADISVCGSWREVDGKKQSKYIFDDIYIYNNEDAVVEMLKREKYNSGTPTKMFKKKIFDYYRFSSSCKYDDADMTYKFFAESNKTVVSGKPLYICVRHSNNNSKGTVEGEKIDENQVEVYLDIFSNRTKWLTRKFVQRQKYWEYTELSYFFSMFEKTRGMEIQNKLKKLLKNNISIFENMKEFYTNRDKEILQKMEEL